MTKVMSGSNEHFMKKIMSLVGRGINRYGLIGAGDRVAVALSGGKDSLALLETLVLRKKRLPIDYHLSAVHVELAEGLYETDRGYLEEFCAGLDVSLVIKKISLGPEPHRDGPPCLICSKKRRGELFTAARELDCSKLALGHHRDDALETLLLNMVFNGATSSMPPKLPLFGGTLEIIRPLILLSEADLTRYASLRGFPDQKKQCPYSGDTRRDEMKKIIARFEDLNPRARTSLFSAMSNIHEDYLPRKEGAEPPKKNRNSGAR
jgi:tRNA(Ile)-lysidine synthase TilS/MesJ